MKLASSIDGQLDGAISDQKTHLPQEHSYNVSENLDGSEIRIIHRSDIPSLHEIEIEGEIHNLGILKDLRKQPFLAAFIPEQARLSISWVHLNPHEVLSIHMHPTASMILVCEGEGRIIGDCDYPLKTGDVAAIPPLRRHGFIGGSHEGLWGLSIQFEGLGLYENREEPRARFIQSEIMVKNEILSSINDFNTLLQDQQYYRNRYKNSRLLTLVKSPLIQDVLVKERLLEVLNFWANWFQRIIFARAAIEGEPSFQNLAEDHIREEIGHNKNLLIGRNHKPIQIWDPILESAASWFFEKMLSGTDAEQTILVHFVLEGSGQIFHSESSNIFTEIDHFRLHGEEDDEHFKMGLQLLQQTVGMNLSALKRTLQRGWDVMQLLCNRMADIAEYGAEGNT